MGNVEYQFSVITLRFTQTWSGITCEGPIYESYRSVRNFFVLDRNTWYVTVQKSLQKTTTQKI